MSGCGLSGETERKRTDGETGQEPLKVVATIFPYYDFARQISGGHTELSMVVPAGMDSHSFEPTPADMRTIQSADVVICNGGAMEHWLSEVLEAVDTSHMTVITMMDYVDTLEEELVEGMEDAGDGHDHEAEEGGESHDPETEETGESHDPETEAAHGAGDADEDAHGVAAGGVEYDEHIWTSPVNAMGIVRVIRDTLIQADPVHEADYRENCGTYLKELERLDEGFRQVSENRKRSTILVADKFPFLYLAKEYGFDYRAAFSGCSEDTEPSAKTIAYLIDTARREQIPAVYYLELSSHRVAEIIGEETGAKPMLLHSCHNVTRAQFESGITYAELMRQNVENLKRGLDE
ncbi:MAG: metal ABC transporter substrate-binding protein [Eubacteriales bacterium]|nr:metal ABC transporter substrate-binding protein [Eubacteriales bacterium]